MTDDAARTARSATMRAVRSADTGPERAVRAVARQLGVGYRLGGWGLAGKPDLVFPGRRKVIFVHGCFWHGHDCRRGARPPKSNADYWRSKIARTRVRDERVRSALETEGWRVLWIWECALGDKPALERDLRAFLLSSEPA